MEKKKKEEPSYQTKIIDDFLRTMWNEDFVYAMEYLREKFGIPEFGFPDETTAQKHFPRESAERLYLSLTTLLEILKLPETFRETLFNVIVFNGRQKLPTKNFKISVRPEMVTEEKTGMILKYPREVVLTTFRALDTEEQKIALKELEVAWEKYFPPYLTKRTNLRNKNIAEKYLIKAELEKRKRGKLEPQGYLKDVIKSYGVDSAHYKKALKSNPHLLKNLGGYTSMDAAKKLAGSAKKAGAMRVTASRLKKKMER